MSFKPTLSTQLSQRLVLTPQLRQRIEMLQMTKLELGDLVTQQLNENPVLEELPPEEVAVSPDLANVDYTETSGNALNGSAEAVENSMSGGESFDQSGSSYETQFTRPEQTDFDTNYGSGSPGEAGPPPARGLFLALGAWTKFAALLLLPLWASYPDWRGAARSKLTYLGGIALGTALGFWILFLEPDPLHAARVFWDRTFGWQLGRESPFSIWDWAQYPGYPDLHDVQTGLKVLLLLAALTVFFVPRVKNELQVAALSAALIIGFEAVLTHWFYLYIPWFFPFAALALLAPAVRRVPPPAQPPPDGREVRELVPAG